LKQQKTQVYYSNILTAYIKITRLAKISPRNCYKGQTFAVPKGLFKELFKNSKVNLGLLLVYPHYKGRVTDVLKK